MKGVFIFLAEGFEETEAVATWDVLKRGGIDAVLVSITDETEVTGAHGLSVKADVDRAAFLKMIRKEGTDSGDVMIFPGGMPGTRNLATDEVLMELMKEHYASGGSVAAICAAPGYVASQLPGFEGKRFTCFDGCEGPALDRGGIYVREPAVIDGNLITGRGPGCAVSFGLLILTHLKGQKTAGEVREGLRI
ncbi:MAG: DJ-1 family glyoxalase III [Candidatus Cryptobacteroides sp.]